MAPERELAVLVKAKDLSTNVIRAIKREYGGLQRTIGQGMGSLARNVERGMIAIGAAAVAGIGYALKAAGDFQAQLNTINTVAQVTPERLGEIGKGIRQLARDTGIAHSDLTSAYYDIVSAGIKAADAQNVLNDAARLGIGGLGTTAEAIDLLTTAINSYGGDASKSAEYADMFAQSVAAGKTTIAEIASTFANVGPQAANLGIELAELAAGYGLLTAKGETAAGASTAMSAAMLALQRTTGPMEALQKKLNVNFAEMAGEKGLAATWQLIAAEAEKAGLPLIEYTGRAEALAYVLGVSGDNAAGYARNLELVEGAHRNSVAQKQFEERQKGLNFQLQRMKILAQDAAITIGEKLLPKIIPRLQELVEWLASHQKEVGKFADEVAAAFDQVVAALGKVPWESVGSALQIAGASAKMVMEWFLKAPAWLQTAIVTGWGLNKLTGGALGSIVGQFATGLIKRVLGITAGVVNVRGAVVNGPGGGVPTGGGRGAGRGGGGGGFPFLPFLGTAAQLLAVGELAGQSNNLSAERGQAQIDVDQGEMTQAEFDRRFNQPGYPGAVAPQSSAGGMFSGWGPRGAIAPTGPVRVTLPDTATNALTQTPAAVRSEAAATRATTISAIRTLLWPLQGILGKNFSPTIRVQTDVTNNISLHEWQRQVRSASTAYSSATRLD